MVLLKAEEMDYAARPWHVKDKTPASLSRWGAEDAEINVCIEDPPNLSKVKA